MRFKTKLKLFINKIKQRVSNASGVSLMTVGVLAIIASLPLTIVIGPTSLVIMLGGVLLTFSGMALYANTRYDDGENSQQDAIRVVTTEELKKMFEENEKKLSPELNKKFTSIEPNKEKTIIHKKTNLHKKSSPLFFRRKKDNTHQEQEKMTTFRYNF